MNRALTTCAALLAIASCKPAAEPEAEQPDPTAFNEVVAAIGQRTSKLRSYRYDGVVTMLEGPDGTKALPGADTKFSYALSQPQRLRLDIEKNRSRFIFDGGVLSVVDDTNKRVMRQDLKKTEPTQVVATLHQVFGDFACEGFKPPMLRPEPENVQVTRSREGWTVDVTLDDDQLAKVQYKLSDPRGDFISKATFDKAGQVVASLRVTASMKHEPTGLSLPTAWERRDRAGAYRVALSDIQVNTGVDESLFVAAAPTDYQATEFGEPVEPSKEATP